jgi:hypothetical protein
MTAWWAHMSPEFPSFSPDFREALGDISGQNPLLLRGFERVAREYKNRFGEIEEKSIKKKRRKTKDKEEQGKSDDEDGGIWSLLYTTDEWLETKTRVEQYAQTYIKNNSDKEKQRYAGAIYLEGATPC